MILQTSQRRINSFNKIDLVLDGQPGNLGLDISMQPFTQDEQDGNLYVLLLQKLQVEASMNIPVQWLYFFADGEYEVQEREDFLAKLVEDKYVTCQGDRLISALSYKNGDLTVNGQPMKDGFSF